MTREVLVTGAASDIGIAICLQYLSNDCRVLGLYNQGQPALTRLAERHPDLTLYPLNFESPENIENFIQKEQSRLNACEIIIHAAALVEPVSFFDMTADNLLKAFTINVIPSILFTRTLVPGMVDRGWGRIVNLSSIGVKYGGGKKTFCYSLSKHALEFFPQDHKTWAASNVLINTLRVGVTDTRMHKVDPDKDMSERVSMIPIKRMAVPEEIARTVYWLGSEENSFITGQVITAAGGE
jgi:NAD(P)-dependent dehydrogenase (short-subunit alcohol dehydrogenase family)